MNKNKIIMFFCDYDTTHSNVGKELGLNRKGEIKTFLDSLEKLRISENANQVLLTFISDKEDFKDNIENLVLEFNEVIKNSNIIFGNHFDHKFRYSCNGIDFDNTENGLPNNSNTIIGDKIKSEIEEFIQYNIITSVRVARNSIGETISLTNDLKKAAISFMQYTFDHFKRKLPDNTEINYSKDRMHANWMDLSALNALLNKEIYVIRQQQADKEKNEQPKQQLMVYKK
jgi:hypothetical protein